MCSIRSCLQWECTGTSQVDQFVFSIWNFRYRVSSLRVNLTGVTFLITFFWFSENLYFVYKFGFTMSQFQLKMNSWVAYELVWFKKNNNIQTYIWMHESVLIKYTSFLCESVWTEWIILDEYNTERCKLSWEDMSSLRSFVFTLVDFWMFFLSCWSVSSALNFNQCSSSSGDDSSCQTPCHTSGYFLFEPSVFPLISVPDTVWPLEWCSCNSLLFLLYCVWNWEMGES